METTALIQLKKMGLELYRATDNQTKWERLTLETNPTNPKDPKQGQSIPCN